MLPRTLKPRLRWLWRRDEHSQSLVDAVSFEVMRHRRVLAAPDSLSLHQLDDGDKFDRGKRFPAVLTPGLGRRGRSNRT